MTFEEKIALAKSLGVFKEEPLHNKLWRGVVIDKFNERWELYIDHVHVSALRNFYWVGPTLPDLEEERSDFEILLSRLDEAVAVKFLYHLDFFNV